MIPLLQYSLDLLTTWANLFAGPLHDPTMLWILIPTYANWIFTEFYQEKHGTSLGNAISNSLIPLWVGWDWLRTLYNTYAAVQRGFDGQAFTKLGIACFLLIYGGHILVQSIKLNKKAQFIGRIRVVTYAVLMLTPLYYGTVPFHYTTFMAIILLFPVFYYIVELFDRVLPDSKVIQQDKAPEEIEIEDSPQAPTQLARGQSLPNLPPTYDPRLQHPYPPPQYSMQRQPQVRR